MRAPRRLLAILPTLGLAVAAVTACGDDDVAAADRSAIADLDGWCDVIGEVDGLSYLAQIASDDLPEQQDRYVAIQRLTRQLRDGVEVVDAAVRDDVAEALGWSVRLADTVVAASSEAELAASLAPIYEEAPDLASALDWVEQRCGVVLDD